MAIEAATQESGPAFNLWILVMPALEGELGWSRTFLSGVGALALVLIAIAIVAGMLALTDSAAGFVIGFGIVAAIGFTAVATNVLAAAIAKNFAAPRGLVTGIGTPGATAGQLLVVPVVVVGHASSAGCSTT